MKTRTLRATLATTVLAAVQTIQAEIIYDAAADFSITNGNPNGVWSYGWMPCDVNQFELFNCAIPGTGGIPVWKRNVSDPPPLIFKNTSSATLLGTPRGFIALTPGPSCDPSVLRWTPPTHGFARVQGQFLAGDGGAVLVEVRSGGVTVWQARDCGTFDLTKLVTPAYPVDFIVSGQGSIGGAHTPLDARITFTPGSRGAFLLPRAFLVVPETAHAVTLEVRLSVPEQMNEAATVDFTTLDGSAHAGEDYAAVSGTLHFAPGETNKLVTLLILDDALREPDEEFWVVLSNPSTGLFLGNTNAVIRIINDDAGVRFADEELVVSEAAGSITATVCRGDSVNQPFTVDFATINGTALASEDYAAASGTLQFAAGETSKQITLSILNDALKEDEEQFRLVLSNPTGGVSLGSSNLVARIRIVNNDAGLRFVAENLVVSEVAGIVAVPVQRGDDLNLPFTVDYTTINGTALASEDYAAASGTLQFAAGETTKQIQLSIVADGLKEGEECFQIRLSNPVGGVSLGDSNLIARVCIQDYGEGVGFEVGMVWVSETAPVVRVSVQRGHDLNQPFTVDYTTVDDTAHAGEDYVAASGTLQFAAGETNKAIVITLLNDRLIEPVEQFRLALSNPTGGVSLGHSNVIIRIQSDEPVTYYVNVNNPNPVFPYATWATAATNIQDAVDVAKAGDTVRVMDGVYAVGSRGNHVGPSRVVVTNAIRLESVNGPSHTTIDGGYDGNWWSGPGVRCVYLGTNAVLSGFTLTNGWTSEYGGGVYCEASGVITNCTLTGNWAGGEWFMEYRSASGGGAYGGTLYDCMLTGNLAEGWVELFFGGYELGNGGGAYDCALYNCTVTGNSAALGGGGVAASTLYDCTLSENSARYYCGGAESCTLYNCTLSGNQYGGAESSTLYNCTVTGNSGAGARRSTLYNSTVTDNAGCGVIGDYWGRPSAAFNSIVYYNSGGNYDTNTILNYCCTTPLPTNGVGNITGPPLFMDFGSGDYRLWEGSPCIDAGTNLLAVLGYAFEPTDILGNTRLIDGDGDSRVAWDIGAYEFNSYKPPRFSHPPRLTVNGWELTITGAHNKWVRVQCSSDLQNWGDLRWWDPWLWMGSEGVKQVNDWDTGQRMRFYRVVVE